MTHNCREKNLSCTRFAIQPDTGRQKRRVMAPVLFAGQTHTRKR